MIITIFLSSIFAPKSKEIFYNFYEGIKKINDKHKIIMYEGCDYVKCDIGIMYLYKSKVKNNIRNKIINNNNCRFIYIDSDPLFINHENHYLRIFLDSIFYNKQTKYMSNFDIDRREIIFGINFITKI